MSLLGVKESDRVSGSPAMFNLKIVDPLYNEQFKGLRAKVEHRIDTTDLRSIAVSSVPSQERGIH